MKTTSNAHKKIALFAFSGIFLLSSCIPTDTELSSEKTSYENLLSKEILSNDDESSVLVEDSFETDLSEYSDVSNSISSFDESELSEEYISDISEDSEVSDTTLESNSSSKNVFNDYSKENSEQSIEQDNGSSEYTSEYTSETSSEEPEIDISEETVTIESAGERYKDKFTDGEVISTENSYISEFVNVSFKEITYEGKLYFVQDIYIKKIECLSVGFAGLKFGKKYNDYVLDMVEDYNQNGYNVVGAINGDYCGLDGKGVIIRNGELYGTGVAQYTICVLYKNGVMKIIDKNSFNAQNELNKGAWHAWDFAPSFLDVNGAPLSTFSERKSISRSNPRTVIGYFEPGHYCFVTAGGRAKGNSYGVSFIQISNFMSSLGCKIAYNLDGGKSAVMVFGNRIVNQKYQGTGRKISDIVFINDIKNEQ